MSRISPACSLKRFYLPTSFCLLLGAAYPAVAQQHVIRAIAGAREPIRTAAKGLAASPTVDTVGARAALRALIATYVSSWNRADAAALGEAYTPTGDLIIPTGEVNDGPQAIAAFYASAFAAGYKGSTGEATLDRIKFPTPDVAVLDGTWAIRGARDAQGNATPPERGIYCAVVIRTGSRWRIVSLREQTSATALKTPPG